MLMVAKAEWRRALEGRVCRLVSLKRMANVTESASNVSSPSFVHFPMTLCR